MLENIRLTNIRKSNDGFTLMELLVVIVIIGFLAAIAIPRFVAQRELANDTLVISDVRTVANVIQETMVQDPNTANITGASAARKINVTVGTQVTGIIDLSDNVAITVRPGTNPTEFIVYGYHSNSRHYKTPITQLVFKSAGGGLQSATGTPSGVSGTP